MKQIRVSFYSSERQYRCLMVPETKIDDSFPVDNFVIDGFSTPYRLYRDSNGGGIMVYVREDIPSNLLATDE